MYIDTTGSFSSRRAASVFNTLHSGLQVLHVVCLCPLQYSMPCLHLSTLDHGIVLGEFVRDHLNVPEKLHVATPAVLSCCYMVTCMHACMHACRMTEH